LNRLLGAEISEPEVLEQSSTETIISASGFPIEQSESSNDSDITDNVADGHSSQEKPEDREF
jgi:hypothetical protein